MSARIPVAALRASRHCVCAIGLFGAAIDGRVAAQESSGFQDEASQRGIVYSVEQLDTFGCGFAFADLDNDGDPDLVLLGRASAGVPPSIGVFENDGRGFFADRSWNNGAPSEPAASGVTAADYDGDGDLDLYISVWLRPNLLLRNDGAFHFTDVSAAAGVDDEGASGGCAWGDFDGDGRLDLYVPNRTGTNLPSGPPSDISNRLFRNRGDGTFEELAAALHVDAGDARSFQACFFDYDHDGDADLYLSNDKGLSSGCIWTNHLWRNDAGVFVDVSAESRAGVCAEAMCITIGDFDRNGWEDIYVTNLPAGNPLLLNNGDGTFTESSLSAGVASYEVGWGSLFFDYDNDRQLDLYVCDFFAANRLYENDGVWPVSDVAGSLGVADVADSFCVASADIDDDGDLDFALVNRSGPVRLFVNESSPLRAWIKFRVVGRRANRSGIGTRVEVSAGGVTQTGQVIAGSGYKTQNDLTIHFGLGDAEQIDTATVFWHAGPTRVLSSYPARATWTLYPPERLGDADGDQAIDLDDFAKLLACFAASETDGVTAGCEMMDFDGDADVDADDVAAFTLRFDAPTDDCNGNEMLDLLDIAGGASADVNRNAVPDECECVGDLDGDAVVGLADLSILLASFGTAAGAEPFEGDLNRDGAVDLADLSILLARFGAACT